MKIITKKDVGEAEQKASDNKDNPEFQFFSFSPRLGKIRISHYEELMDKVPTNFYDAWLEDCELKVKDWVESKDKKDKYGLFIFGATGTGKTYALFSLYRNLLLQGYRSRIINVVELLRLFKKDFKYKDENNFENYLEYQGMLLIDDIGAEKNSEFVDETLYHLINTRYEEGLPTFFSSNLSLKELAEKNGDRLASRIAGMCGVVELKGEDKRLK